MQYGRDRERPHRSSEFYQGSIERIQYEREHYQRNQYQRPPLEYQIDQIKSPFSRKPKSFFDQQYGGEPQFYKGPYERNEGQYQKENLRRQPVSAEQFNRPRLYPHHIEGVYEPFGYEDRNPQRPPGPSFNRNNQFDPWVIPPRFERPIPFEVQYPYAQRFQPKQRDLDLQEKRQHFDYQQPYPSFQDRKEAYPRYNNEEKVRLADYIKNPQQKDWVFTDEYQRRMERHPYPQQIDPRRRPIDEIQPKPTVKPVEIRPQGKLQTPPKTPLLYEMSPFRDIIPVNSVYYTYTGGRLKTNEALKKSFTPQGLGIHQNPYLDPQPQRPKNISQPIFKPVTPFENIIRKL